MFFGGSLLEVVDSVRLCCVVGVVGVFCVCFVLGVLFELCFGRWVLGFALVRVGVGSHLRDEWC